jgi:manganese transport protein
VVFAFGLLLSGFSSSVTAAMAGGSIFAGAFREPLDLSDSHSRIGIAITVVGALVVIFFLRDPFQGLIWSQIALSVQLPLTIFALIFLTSSPKVMGRFANPPSHRVLLWATGLIVILLNIMLLVQFVTPSK